MSLPSKTEAIYYAEMSEGEDTVNKVPMHARDATYPPAWCLPPFDIINPHLTNEPANGAPPSFFPSFLPPLCLSTYLSSPICT